MSSISILFRSALLPFGLKWFCPHPGPPHDLCPLSASHGPRSRRAKRRRRGGGFATRECLGVAALAAFASRGETRPSRFAEAAQRLPTPAVPRRLRRVLTTRQKRRRCKTRKAGSARRGRRKHGRFFLFAPPPLLEKGSSGPALPFPLDGAWRLCPRDGQTTDSAHWPTRTRGLAGIGTVSPPAGLLRGA